MSASLSSVVSRHMRRAGTMNRLVMQPMRKITLLGHITWAGVTLQG